MGELLPNVSYTTKGLATTNMYRKCYTYQLPLATTDDIFNICTLEPGDMIVVKLSSILGSDCSLKTLIARHNGTAVFAKSLISGSIHANFAFYQKGNTLAIRRNGNGALVLTVDYSTVNINVTKASGVEDYTRITEV